VRLTPDNPRAYDYLALSLEPLGQFERAEWAYKQGLKVNKQPLFDAFLDYNYGRFLMKLNRLAEAQEHLNRAVELTPDTRAVFYERAKLHEKLGNYPQALKDSEKALEMKDPGAVILDLQVYYQLARVHTRMGNQEMAATYTKLAQNAKVPASSRMRGGR
jgi:tetratricopeptide (TPR) repeat protein